VSSIVSLAKRYRRHGFNILPIGEDKRPLVSWREWKDRHQTRDDLKAMPWDEAQGIGGLSGDVSGHRYCLDFDRVTDPAVLKEVQGVLGLPADYGWSVRTPGGGAHIWVTSPELAGRLNGKGKLTGSRPGCDHVELRGRGHQTLLPGSKHPSGGIYAFAHADAVKVPAEPPTEVDAELVLQVARWQEEKPALTRVESGPAVCIDHPWVQAALRGEIEKLAAAREGERNNQLNRSGMALGSLLPLELADVVAELLPVALASGLEERESRATIKSGFEAGRKTPRSIPEQERALSLIWSRENEAPSSTEPGKESLITELIDWDAFWEEDFQTAEWVYEDVLAKGRGHAIFASHKAGKSLLTLHMAAQMATGTQRLVVLYLDYEMTPADLYDRLDDMGYGPETDLSRLCYALLPTLPPLDTSDGAERLMELCQQVQGRLPDHHLVVVIDTISRAVAGPENESDTFRAFYNHTGIRLKRAGITWVRLDHAGKDETKDQRGTSAKGDDVDVVWKLSRAENSILLKRTVSRMGWVPDKVTFAIQEEPWLTFERTDRGWPVGTELVANLLDRLGIPPETSANQSQKLLREAGEKHRREVITAAVRWRRERAEMGLGTTLGTTGTGPGDRGGNQSEKPAETEAGTVLEPPGTTYPAEREPQAPPFKGGRSVVPAPDFDPDDGGDTPWLMRL
jgi:hypothetical protein